MADGIYNLNVLLIEDDDHHAALIDRQLQRVNGHSISITREVRLATGLKQLSRQVYDAILLDLNLPDSTGLETCNRVCDVAGSTPVIALSAAAAASDAVRLVRDRAEDFLPKSNLDGELIVRAIVCAVERAARRNAEADLQHAKGQLDAARQIQTELLPTDPPTIPGFEIAAASWPAEVVAGDYYDFFPATDGTVGIALGDAAGHGPRAAMLMAVGAGCIRSAFDAGGDLGSVLARVNAVLDHHPPSIALMTLLLTRLDIEKRTLVYASAGHPHGYLFDDQGRFQQRLDECNGVVLGVIAQCAYATSEPISLPPGRLLLMVSDGVIEAHSAGDGMFGEKRFYETIAEHHDESCEAITQAIHDAVVSYLNGAPADDDITVVAIRSVN